MNITYVTLVHRIQWLPISFRERPSSLAVASTASCELSPCCLSDSISYCIPLQSLRSFARPTRLHNFWTSSSLCLEFYHRLAPFPDHSFKIVTSHYFLYSFLALFFFISLIISKYSIWIIYCFPPLENKLYEGRIGCFFFPVCFVLYCFVYCCICSIKKIPGAYYYVLSKYLVNELIYIPLTLL